MGGEEEGMDMDGDLELTDEEAQAIIDLGSKLEAAMGGMDDMDMDMDADDDAEEESVEFEATDEEVDEASDDEEVEESDDEETDESAKSEAETMREYVEKVSATMGDNGDNTKSPVAGKNDMGGDASNLVAGGEADTKGTTGGLEGNSAKEENMGNVNVPGGKAAKSMKSMPKGHGAEKKGAGEGADNKKAVIGS